MGRRLDLDQGGVLALVVFALTLAVIAAHGLGTPAASRDLDPLASLLVGAASAPLVFAGRAPLRAFVATAAGALLVGAFHYPYDVPFGPLAASYFVAAAYAGSPRAERLRAQMVVGCFVPATAVVLQVTDSPLRSALSGLGFWALLFVGTWLAADRARLRAEHIADLELRAERTERDAQQERRLVIAEERTRIARELHDSAGHAVNVVLVQAGAARLLAQRDPEAAARAVAHVEEVARGLIEEIDRLVHVLREEHEEVPLTPTAPARVDDLLEQLQADGLEVATTIQGHHDQLPSSVSWATYRILQEALTNASRHGCGTANMRLSYTHDEVRVTVTNPARPKPARPDAAPFPRGGHGIVGMSERASLLGGSLTAGVDGGLFRVEARLPTTGRRT